MHSELISLKYEIKLEPGESLALPETIIAQIGPGRWIITIQPVDAVTSTVSLRDHRAFLNSYAPEDEGLYDEYPTG